jgi:hypothetical protein
MPTIPNVRPRVLKRRLALVGLGGLLAAAVVSMPAARADTVSEYVDKNAAEICLMLDHNPSVAGVDFVAGQLLAHHLPPKGAAAVLLMSVNEVCPWYLPEVFAWANQTAPSNAYVA